MSNGFRISRLKVLFTGYTTGKAQESDFQRQMVFLIALIATPTALLFSIVNFIHGHTLLSAVEMLAIVLLIPCFRVVQKPQTLALSKNLLMLNALIVFSALFIDGGIGNTGVIWTLIVPVLAVLLMGLPIAWYWIAVFSTVLGISIAFHIAGLYPLPYNNDLLLHYPAALLFFSLIAAAIEAQLERLHVKHEMIIEELQELQSNLKHTIKHRTASLQKINDKLQAEVKHHKETSQALRDSEERFFQAQKMESIGTLVGGIAHDFNNMLAGIIANLFMLKQKVSDNPELTNRIDNINQLATGAADMIKQLLTFARKDNVEYKAFDLLPFMNEAYKLASVSISSRTKLTYDFPSGSIWVKANATQLQQVLMNLINNARDAVKDQDDPTIKVVLQQIVPSDAFRRKHPDLSAEKYAKLTVADNGNGMNKTTISKIFEPFFTTKGAGKGTGLGLSMCYGAIKGHDGTIEVESSPEVGTSLHVYLPVFDEESDSNLTDTLKNAVRGNGEGILLVEDDPILRKIQRETLSTLGYRLFEAGNGKEAISMYEDHGDQIELIIMDVVMPIMGGVEAAHHIRKMRKNMNIIFVTGYDPEGTIDGKNLPGPADFILDKPFTIDELSHAVRKQLLGASD